MRSVMTCDKHTGEYYFIPGSQCFTAIDSVGRSPTEPIRYCQDKTLSMLIGFHQERDNTSITRFFSMEKEMCACFLMLGNSNANENRIWLHFLTYARPVSYFA